MPISDQELEQIETLKFESVDPKVQTQLSLTNVKALEHMGKYSEALARLNESRPNISQSEYQSLRTQILGRFVDSSKDVEFLNVALDGNFVSEPADLQNQAAQRLLELGFLDEADEVISKQAVGVAMTERRYIRAEISSARGDDERVKAQRSNLVKN